MKKSTTQILTKVRNLHRLHFDGFFSHKFAAWSMAARTFDNFVKHHKYICIFKNLNAQVLFFTGTMTRGHVVDIKNDKAPNFDAHSRSIAVRETRRLPRREFSRAFVTGLAWVIDPPACFSSSYVIRSINGSLPAGERCNKAWKTSANWTDSFSTRLTWKVPRDSAGRPRSSLHCEEIRSSRSNAEAAADEVDKKSSTRIGIYYDPSRQLKFPWV